MQRAVIYARYSTEHQTEKSIEDQVALCRRHAEREGLSVGRVYSDRARTSATLYGRQGIADLLGDARRGLFDAVIVESLDRVSRDQADLATVYKRLEFARIPILTVNEGRADGLLIGLRGLLGGMHLKDTRDKVIRGMEGVIRDGRNAGGRAYGYRPVPGRPGILEIVEAEAEVVCEIHRLYLEEHGPKAIAGILNDRGVLPPRGTKWNASTINGNAKRGYGLLSNPLYDGRLVWNRVEMVRDPDTGRRVSRDKPAGEWMSAPAEHLRIVPAALFAAVQERRAAQSRCRAEGRPVKRAARPFSGLLRCSCCGKGMAVHDRRGDVIRIRCATAMESGTCNHTTSARLDRIEGELLDRLGETLTDEAYLRAYVEAYREERAAAATRSADHVPALKKKFAQARADHGRAVDLVVRGVLEGPEAEDRIRTLQREIDDVGAALADARQEEIAAEPVADAPERFAASITALSRRLRDPDPVLDREAVSTLRSVIDRIVVHPKSEDGTNDVEVIGDLAALIAPMGTTWGGKGVAEVRLERTPGHFLSSR